MIETALYRQITLNPGNDALNPPYSPEHRDPSPAYEKRLRLPEWFRRPLPSGKSFLATKGLVSGLGLATVCQGANCPNAGECHSAGTATFMILGTTCTRNCRFCNIAPADPGPPQDDEPDRVAAAAKQLGLKHVVITSVTRDDLADGGATHFAATIRAVRGALPDSTVEVLVPDFKGDEKALEIVMEASPEVINHNVETHGSLYSSVRPQADYGRSLELLGRVSRRGGIAKSGFMVGVGESDELVKTLLADLRDAGCSIVTIGQYLSPSREHLPVARYVRPERFEEYAEWGHSLGLPYVFSSPLMRSSYHAKQALDVLLKGEPR